MQQGLSNELDFEAAVIDDDFFGGVTKRGNKLQTRRQRTHFQYFEVKNK